MGGPGFVLSFATLKLLHPFLGFCLDAVERNNMLNSDTPWTAEDIELGRCISRTVGIQCSASHQVSQSGPLGWGGVGVSLHLYHWGGVGWAYLYICTTGVGWAYLYICTTGMGWGGHISTSVPLGWGGVGVSLHLYHWDGVGWAYLYICTTGMGWGGRISTYVCIIHTILGKRAIIP